MWGAVLVGVLLVAPGVGTVGVVAASAELERTKAGALARELDLRGSDLDSAARLSQEGEAAVVALATLQSDEKRDRAELSQVEELLQKQESLVQQRLASAEQRDELK